VNAFVKLSVCYLPKVVSNSCYVHRVCSIFVIFCRPTSRISYSVPPTANMSKFDVCWTVHFSGN